MHLPSRLLSLLLVLAAATASPVNRLVPRVAPPDAPAYFVLAGDSTTASPSDSGGGWGDGFLTTTLKGGASGKNFGHNGATTASFREDGDWDAVLGDVKCHTEVAKVWVTIQFGHNDQKAKNGVTLEQYSANLKTFCQEVKDAGGTPILLTPLSRRSFKDGKVKEDLAEQRAATLAVALEIGVLVLDLNEASTCYLNAIGEDNAHRYNRIPSDNTHLNVAGGEVFGNMVSWLMTKSTAGIELGRWTQPEPKILTAFEQGTFYFPGES